MGKSASDNREKHARNNEWHGEHEVGTRKALPATMPNRPDKTMTFRPLRGNAITPTFTSTTDPPQHNSGDSNADEREAGKQIERPHRIPLIEAMDDV